MGLLEDFVDGTIDLVHDGYDFVVKAGQETVENFVETTTAGLVDMETIVEVHFLTLPQLRKTLPYRHLPLPGMRLSPRLENPAYLL